MQTSVRTHRHWVVAPLAALCFGVTVLAPVPKQTTAQLVAQPTIQFLDEQSAVVYTTDDGTYTLEAGQALVASAGFSTIRVPYYNLHFAHGGAYVSVKNGTLTIAAVFGPVLIEDSAGDFFIMPEGTKWETNQKILQTQNTPDVRLIAYNVPQLPRYYWQEKHAQVQIALTKPFTLPPHTPELQAIFTNTDLVQVRYALQQMASTVPTAELLPAITYQLLTETNVEKQSILLEYVQNDPIVAAFFSVYPPTQEAMWAYVYANTPAPIAVLYSVPLAYLTHGLSASALQNWYTQFATHFESARLTKERFTIFSFIQATVTPALVEQFPARSRMLATYWQQLLETYPAQDTAQLQSLLQTIFTTPVPIIPATAVTTNTAPIPADLSTEKRANVAAMAEAILLQTSIMFTTNTQIEPQTLAEAAITDAVIGGKTADYSISFTLNIQDRTVRNIQLQNTQYPNVLPLDQFMAWATSL